MNAWVSGMSPGGFDSVALVGVVLAGMGACEADESGESVLPAEPAAVGFDADAVSLPADPEVDAVTTVLDDATLLGAGASG
jgi:hypothetical protein